MLHLLSQQALRAVPAVSPYGHLRHLPCRVEDRRVPRLQNPGWRFDEGLFLMLIVRRDSALKLLLEVLSQDIYVHDFLFL
ncbi:unnamed protein product [Cylicostephanus goldi]|uniref:Uncharacterized protein n=1 Tax=Cylicostephanus goldi TaxID=71465 RepID=A0A3P7MEP9_CYLGO|nr:unnamed protein product [Cylicostephanus goldi]